MLFFFQVFGWMQSSEITYLLIALAATQLLQSHVDVERLVSTSFRAPSAKLQTDANGVLTSRALPPSLLTLRAVQLSTVVITSAFQSAAPRSRLIPGEALFLFFFLLVYFVWKVVRMSVLHQHFLELNFLYDCRTFKI